MESAVCNGVTKTLVLFAWFTLLSPSFVMGVDQPPHVPPLQVPVDQLDGIQRATIILDSYSYTPNHLIIQAGKPVELLLTSITTITPHNFILKDDAAGLSI